MNTIATALERLEVAVGGRPGFGVRTCHSTTTVVDGLRCTTEEGPWQTAADLPDSLGGGATAPTPSMLLRAALGSCMAMTYQLRAARHGVQMTAIRVTIETDSDLAGMLLTDAPAPPGFTALRYHVEVESPAPAEVVASVLDEGDRLSPLLDVMTRGHAVRRTTAIRSSAG